MKVEMKSITIYGLKRDRKRVMEFLQKKGAVEFKNVEDDNLGKLNVSDEILGFERYMTNTAKALEILNRYVPEKTPMFALRKTLPMNMFSMDTSEYAVVGNEVLSIISSDKKIEDMRLEINRIKLQIDAMKRWMLLDVPLSFSGTKTTKAALYTLPYEANEETIYSLFGDAGDKVYCEIIDASKDISCVFMTYLKEDSEEVEKAVREAGFGQPSFSLSHLTANDKIKQLSDKVVSLEENIKKTENALKASADNRDKIRLFADHIRLRCDKYTALCTIGQTDKVFVIEGYAPKSAAVQMKDDLEKTMLSVVIIGDIPDDEEAPVLLSNNGFAQPVEGITATYSMPSKFDIDPNFIMAIFYYIFFGMMFSDAGYGLLVALVTGYLSFFANVEKQTKITMRMFFFCGVSTTFWGFMYGSFFGDAITQIGATFFGHPEWKFPALWLDPVAQPLVLLIVSVCLGVIQIVTGLFIAFHTNWKKGDRSTALFDIGSWIFILLGVMAFAGSMMLDHRPSVYALMRTVGIGAIAIGFIAIVLMKGRASRNPLLRIGSGLLGLYDITSYVSDALSYSRLMALGLSTGVIAQVVNTMGTLGGKNVVGVIMFLTIFLVGHAINFAINMLGAYVHTNRLQYVEFFSKFYEGGGRAFAPLKMNTKYYIFKEE